MGKVIFEFDEIEDSQDIKNIVNRNKLIYALDELKKYQRRLCKGCVNNQIIVEDRNVIAEGTKILALEGNIEGQKTYMPVNDIIDELDNCLNSVISLLDY